MCQTLLRLSPDQCSIVPSHDPLTEFAKVVIYDENWEELGSATVFKSNFEGTNHNHISVNFMFSDIMKLSMDAHLKITLYDNDGNLVSNSGSVVNFKLTGSA